VKNPCYNVVKIQSAFLSFIINDFWWLNIVVICSSTKVINCTVKRRVFVSIIHGVINENCILMGCI